MTSNLVLCRLDSPVGRLTLVASDEGVRAVLWPNDRPNRVPLAPTVTGSHPVLAQAVDELDAYFGGVLDGFTFAYDLHGTPFQLAVWRALGEIAAGTTVTYGQLAATLGRPTASRAVGAAVGRNPVSIALPCHRVVGSNGSLTGFAGGLAAKEWLLRHEGALSA